MSRTHGPKLCFRFFGNGRGVHVIATAGHGAGRGGAVVAHAETSSAARSHSERKHIDWIL